MCLCIVYSLVCCGSVTDCDCLQFSDFVCSSFEQFQSDGLPLLQRLVESGYYIPCLRAFSNIFPQLISNRRVLVHDERYCGVWLMGVVLGWINGDQWVWSS